MKTSFFISTNFSWIRRKARALFGAVACNSGVVVLEHLSLCCSHGRRISAAGRACVQPPFVWLCTSVVIQDRGNEREKVSGCNILWLNSYMIDPLSMTSSLCSKEKKCWVWIFACLRVCNVLSDSCSLSLFFGLFPDSLSLPFSFLLPVFLSVRVFLFSSSICHDSFWQFICVAKMFIWYFSCPSVEFSVSSETFKCNLCLTR